MNVQHGKLQIESVQLPFIDRISSNCDSPVSYAALIIINVQYSKFINQMLSDNSSNLIFLVITP